MAERVAAMSGGGEREPEILRKYDDEDRPRSCCYDCGLSYEDDGFHDLLIADYAWERINPTHHKGAGLLCSVCIVRRCEQAGLRNVPAAFVSGPLRTMDAYVFEAWLRSDRLSDEASR